MLELAELQKAIGLKIREKRLQKKRSQAQLALEMLKDRQTVSRVELGKTSITLKTLVEFSNALAVDYKELLP